MLPETFRTERLRAERLSERHQGELERFHVDPAVMAELGGVRSSEQTASYLSRNLRHWSEFGFGVWMLRESHGTDLVGRAILRHLDVEGRDEIEVGYSLYPKYWGLGLATEIGQRCLEFARHDLGLNTCVGVTTLGNRASQHVLEKLGMSLERQVEVEETPYRIYRVSWVGADASGVSS